MTLVIILLLVAVVAVAVIVQRNRAGFAAANEILPGVVTAAPASWAGAHTPEARLHRRIRDAMTSLRDGGVLDAPELAEATTGLEQEAMAIDERLIAVAAIPGAGAAEHLNGIAAAVEELEAAVTEVLLARRPSADVSTTAIDSVRTRLQLVREARAELAAMGTSPDLAALARELGDALPEPPGVDPVETAPEPMPPPPMPPDPTAQGGQ